MSKKEGMSKMYKVMFGAFLVGAIITVFGTGIKQRIMGLGFILVGLIIAAILQFVMGEDVIRFRKPKQMK